MSPSANSSSREQNGSSAILVVDDVEDNREVLAARLGALGHEDVTLANDGRQALQLIAGRSFDLVLLDVMMPHVNGIQVLEALREQGRLESLPVIMVSASNEMSSVVRCIELGAEDYLTKPVNPVLLRARIGATLEKKRLRDASRARLAQLDRELRTARELQLGMVPEGFDASDVSLAVILEPAREVGGDLCDALVRGRLLWFAVGDVSGKGAAAALFMARTWSSLRAAILREANGDGHASRPGEVLSEINSELCEANSSSMFTTLFVGCLQRDTGLLEYASAGHPLPMHVGKGGIATLDASPLLPVGAWSETEYPTQSLQLAPGDTLFVFSDGLTEAMKSSGEQFGETRVQEALQRSSSLDAEGMLSSVLATVAAFADDAPPSDDLAALCLRWKG
jgi:sigma-B regulation protein RsbU (phosphoserine phosphatase)